MYHKLHRRQLNNIWSNTQKKLGAFSFTKAVLNGIFAKKIIYKSAKVIFVVKRMKKKIWTVQKYRPKILSVNDTNWNYLDNLYIKFWIVQKFELIAPNCQFVVQKKCNLCAIKANWIRPPQIRCLPQITFLIYIRQGWKYDGRIKS